MERRRSALITVGLLVAGFVVGIFWREPIGRFVRGLMPATEATWDEQIRQDALSLVPAIEFNPSLPGSLAGQPDLWRAWDARRSFYTPDRLQDLARRLNAFVDFVVAEHEDAAEIYRQGLLDTTKSDASVAARGRIQSAFGAQAAALVAASDKMRDEAYKASPKTAGYDPEMTNYVQLLEAVRDWTPRARARIDELTKPLAEKH